MKQLLQSAADGSTTVVDVPAPIVAPGCILVRNYASLVSAGTERTAVEFAKKSLLAKARSRPDLVKKVIDKARTDGPMTALGAAFTRLDQPMALGYSSAGVVVDVGSGIEGVRVGDQVACAGGGVASHAEYICVPRNLAAGIPQGVSPESAAFAAVGAIGLHGVRLAEVALGDRIAVIGLGLIGLLTVQMLRAAGCQVLGIDPNRDRMRLAAELGAQAVCTPAEADAACGSMTGGVGADAVVITAGTSSNQPIELTGRLARDRGRVVVVGAVGMDLPRPPFFEKELSFRVSRSYGPGRYDPVYEEQGIDYPIGYVRWTENRNLSAFLELIASGAVRIDPLVSHRIPIAEGEQAYALLTSPEAAPLGVVLVYGDLSEAEAGAPAVEPRRRVAVEGVGTARGAAPGLGVLGAGNFAMATLLPAVSRVGGFTLTGIASARGPSAHHAANKYKFRFAATAEQEILSDQGTDIVAILTRHDLHARQIVSTLAAGKHVFCEKPPCLNGEELGQILRALQRAPDRMLTLGYNRRFAPFVMRAREHMAGADEPLVVQIRVNAGTIPPGHWVHDPIVGGGRIVGEVCHFVDLVGYLTGAVPVGVSAVGTPDGGGYREDNVLVTLSMSDGSVASIAYVASGDRALGKERFEVFGGSRVVIIDDFRTLRTLGGGRSRTERSRLSQDKGHQGEWEAIQRALRGQADAPIATESWVATSLATFAAVRSLRSGEPQRVDARGFIGEAMDSDGTFS